MESSTQATADALAQEDDIQWLREIGIFPSAVLYEIVIHSPKPFTHPAHDWLAGKVWAYSVLRRDAKSAADASGTTSYPRRIWFQILDPRDIEREPQAAQALRVLTATITVGKPSEPA